MLIDLRDLMTKPGEMLDFTAELDISDMEFSYQYPADVPLHVVGIVRNVASILEFEADLTAKLQWECDRCLTPFTETKTMTVTAVLAESAENPENEDIFLLDQGAFCVEDIVLPEFALDMSSKHLCRPDCAGLCPQCGKDLNNGPCGCDLKVVDPRLAVLQDLL